jgi:hypothetical protein
MFLPNPIVLDNIIPEKYQLEIEQTLTSLDFDWHFNKSVSYGEGNKVVENFKKNDENIIDGSAFVHRFFLNNKISDNNLLYKSQYCDFIRPILFFVEEKLKIEIAEILRIRGVLTPPNSSSKNKYNIPHTDTTEKHYTLIYYVSDNDGGTILFKEKMENNITNFDKKNIDHFVQSKKGRILLFDGLTYHTGVIPTDNNKILININFI